MCCIAPPPYINIVYWCVVLLHHPILISYIGVSYCSDHPILISYWCVVLLHHPILISYIGVSYCSGHPILISYWCVVLLRSSLIDRLHIYHLILPYRFEAHSQPEYVMITLYDCAYHVKCFFDHTHLHLGFCLFIPM